MKTLIAATAALTMLAALSACDGPSRPQPESEGSIFNPVCLPDGSVAYHQLANDDGSYGKPKASYENCPWNKKQ